LLSTYVIPDTVANQVFESEYPENTIVFRFASVFMKSSFET